MPFDPDDLNKKNNSGKGSNKQSNEDFINSSFAVQFKPGDKSNTVSDKLKEGNNVKDDFDSFKDEFDDFEIDDTISAFKPLGQKETPKAEPKEEPVKAEPAKKEESSIPAFPKNGGTFDRKPSDNVSKGPDKSNTPVFGSDKAQTRPAASQKKDEKLFNSGKDLDYATSEHDKDKSPFANAERPSARKADKKPEVKTYGTVSSGVNAFSSANILDDIPEVGAEEKPAPSPFVIRPTPSPKPAMPKTDTTHHAPKAPAAHTAPAAAKAQNEQKNEKAAPAPHVAPAAAKAAQNEKSAPAARHTAPAAAKAAEKKEQPAHTAPALAKAAAKDNDKPAHTAPAAAKAQSEQKNEKSAPAAAAANKPAGQRPGEAAKAFTAPTFSRPAPTGAAKESIRPEDPRRMLAVEKSQKTPTAPSHPRPGISPVDTVKKTKKKKIAKEPKDPGIGGVITLAVIIVAFVGILLILQNIDKIGAAFGRKPVETLPTIQTTTTAVTTETPATTESATETTTEATTESTTEETTTAETTTEATTVATTTTEATTATTQSSKKVVNYGIATSKFSSKVANFRTVSGGFKYDVIMVNKSGKTASFKKSLKSVSLSLLTEPAIKSMSSSSLSFKAKNGQWVGTPKRDFSIKPGAKVTITVTVKTYGTAQYYAYRAVNFKYH